MSTNDKPAILSAEEVGRLALLIRGSIHGGAIAAGEDALAAILAANEQLRDQIAADRCYAVRKPRGPNGGYLWFNGRGDGWHREHWNLGNAKAARFTRQDAHDIRRRLSALQEPHERPKVVKLVKQTGELVKPYCPRCTKVVEAVELVPDSESPDTTKRMIVTCHGVRATGPIAIADIPRGRWEARRFLAEKADQIACGPLLNGKPSPRAELDAIHAEKQRLEERQRALYAASVAAPAEEKVCDDWMAEMLGREPFGKPFTFPVDVHGITYSGELVQDPLLTRTKPGAWVKVRPCDKDLDGKTYLGVYLGGLALSLSCRHHRETGVLEVARCMWNPAMWVPDLKRIVFGAGSWWGEVKSPDDLREISDADINNVFYVRALRELTEKPSDAA